MKKSLLVIALLAATAAHATNKPTPTNPTTPITVSAGASASAKSDSSSSAAASNSLANAFDGSNMYVFPAPVMAAPLPANLCPQGDSLSWSIGWNFFSYAKSSTRTEMDCLEKVLATIKATSMPIVQPTLAPMTPAEQKQLACLEQPKKVTTKKKVRACS